MGELERLDAVDPANGSVLDSPTVSSSRAVSTWYTTSPGMYRSRSPTWLTSTPYSDGLFSEPDANSHSYSNTHADGHSEHQLQGQQLLRHRPNRAQRPPPLRSPPTPGRDLTAEMSALRPSRSL